MAQTPELRFTRLCASLGELAEAEPRLESLTPDGGGGVGCAIRFSSEHGSTSVLDVRPGRVTVTTRSEEMHPRAGDSTIIDDLGVHLDEGYAWDDVTCTSANALARLLVKHLYRRAKEVDPEPQMP